MYVIGESYYGRTPIGIISAHQFDARTDSVDSFSPTVIIKNSGITLLTTVYEFKFRVLCIKYLQEFSVPETTVFIFMIVETLYN